VSLSAEGILEAYVLISRADAGIARDYPAYRDGERDKISRYIATRIVRPPLKP
jgi:hypothetical protein